ncbi:hypothetical protein D3C85_1935680 [compost metagenome]
MLGNALGLPDGQVAMAIDLLEQEVLGLNLLGDRVVHIPAQPHFQFVFCVFKGFQGLSPASGFRGV